MDVHRSSKPTRRDRYSRPAPNHPVGLPAGISVLQTLPVRGSNGPGCGSGPTDPPLKRRSARERRARSNRAPGANSWSRYFRSKRRQLVGEQRLPITTASPDRHRGRYHNASLAQWESTAPWTPHEVVRFHQLVPIPAELSGEAAVSKTASAWVRSLPPAPPLDIQLLHGLPPRP
jgi:hypothetical protein